MGHGWTGGVWGPRVFQEGRAAARTVRRLECIQRAVL